MRSDPKNHENRSSNHGSAPGLRPQMVWRVAWRDLLSTLRDRRTLTSTILIPMLLIPLFTLGMPLLIGKLVGGQAESRQKVGVIVPESSAGELPARLRQLLQADEKDASGKVIRAGLEIREYAGYSPEQANKLVQSGEVDAVIRAASPLPTAAGNTSGTLELYAKLSNLKAQTGAFAKIKEVVEAYNRALTVDRLQSLGLSAAALTPVTVKPVDASPPQEQKSGQLAFLIPMLMLQFILAGAMSTALDATAGEKERGTLESLLITPVRRGEVVAGKLLSTTLTALMTAAFSLVGFILAGLAASVLMKGMDRELTQAMGGQLTLTPLSLLYMLSIVLSAALLISGVLIALAIYARSYKEAQTYVTPLSLLIVFPAVALQFADFLKFGPALYATPLFGGMVSILDIVRGTATGQHVLMATLANLLGAALLGLLARRSFGREEVIFRN